MTNYPSGHGEGQGVPLAYVAAVIERNPLKYAHRASRDGGQVMRDQF